MIISKKTTGTFFALLIIFSAAKAQETTWQEYMRNMTFSPRYFGPNAFPLPELRSGYLDNRIEVELRGEYHAYKGDQAKDIYGRILIPVAEGRAGIEVSGVFYEYYHMTQETVIERHTSGQYWPDGARGDLIISSFYQLFGKNKWVDLLLESSLKTASGTRLSDARYTDAASYWFDVNAGFHLYKDAGSSSFIRLQGLVGFYCWMTNEIVHRQNDAFLYSAGINGGTNNLKMQVDIAGFVGYKNIGDRPIILRTKLNYEFRNNILSFRFKHGINDYFYNTCSLAYIRCF